MGAFLTLALMFLTAFVVVKFGIIPANADGTHSSLEVRIMSAARRASVARHATAEKNPLPLNEENLKAGLTTYRQMCARCHATPGSEPSVYGQAFYPTAPQLSAEMARYTDAQLFWITKHGIRNTGMPAWGSMLSDDEMWQVVSVIKNLQNLPPAVEVEWDAPKKKTAQ